MTDNNQTLIDLLEVEWALPHRLLSLRPYVSSGQVYHAALPIGCTMRSRNRRTIYAGS